MGFSGFQVRGNMERNFFLVFRDFQFQDVFALENVARTFWGGLIKLQILLEY